MDRGTHRWAFRKMCPRSTRRSHRAKGNGANSVKTRRLGAALQNRLLPRLSVDRPRWYVGVLLRLPSRHLSLHRRTTMDPSLKAPLQGQNPSCRSPSTMAMRRAHLHLSSRLSLAPHPQCSNIHSLQHSQVLRSVDNNLMRPNLQLQVSNRADGGSAKLSRVRHPRP